MVDEELEKPGEWFGAESHEPELKSAQDRVCHAVMVSAVAYEGEEPPPYVAHVYMRDGEGTVWAGIVWRPDRLPTVDEISDALVRWRSHGGESSPVFHVEWWKGDGTTREE